MDQLKGAQIKRNLNMKTKESKKYQVSELQRLSNW